MPESTFAQCFADLMRSLEENGIKRPVSIELASKQEALKILREVELVGWLGGSTSCQSVASDIESGKMRSFLLFNIEFWWRRSPTAIELQQGLRAAA